MFINPTTGTGTYVGWKNDYRPCCPECGDPQGPAEVKPCTCANLMISIPPGQHIHVSCPRHGRVRIDGPMVTW